METKHTPGPWIMEPRQPGQKTIRITSPGTNDYFVTLHCEIDCDDVDHDVAIANAKLIAAAPDLAEACRKVLEFHDADCAPARCVFCDCEQTNHLPDCPVSAARAALAKAGL